MIDHLDALLRAVLLQGVDGLAGPGQVRFQPPDDEWRTAVANLQVDGAVNVYLAEVRANPELRSQRRERSVRHGVAVDQRPPLQVDCHYLVSAWSPVRVTDQVEPTLDEHALLYRVLAALEDAAPLNATRVYRDDPTRLAGVPELIRDADLPTRVAPAEGFARLADFWGAMGVGNRWRPVVELVVTLPVAVAPDLVGRLVTTQVVGSAPSTRGRPGHRWLRIAGTVRTGAGTPVADAQVFVETLDGTRLRAAVTAGSGRWTSDGLDPGRYRLRTRTEGRPDVVQEVDVPSGAGGYDVTVGS
jgi:hypothetical protein